MSQFNAEKHLEDVSKIADQLLKLLGETGRLLARKSSNDIIDYQSEAERLVKGQSSSLLGYTDCTVLDEPIYREGKFKLLPSHELSFVEKKQVLTIPQKLEGHLSEEDVSLLKDTGHLNRIIYVDQNGVAKAHYLSLDQDLNEIALLPVNRFKLQQEVMGVKLSKEQRDSLLSGETVLLKGLINPKQPEQPFDSLVTIDAIKGGLSFQSPYTIPPTLAGKALSTEQVKALESGETLMLTGLYSRTKDRYYDAYVSLNSDKENLAITPYSVPKHLLGRELSQEQVQALRIGQEVFVSGLTSKNGELFDAYIQLNKEKGIHFKRSPETTTEVITKEEKQEVFHKTQDKQIEKVDYSLSSRLRPTPGIVVSNASVWQSPTEAPAKKVGQQLGRKH